MLTPDHCRRGLLRPLAVLSFSVLLLTAAACGSGESGESSAADEWVAETTTEGDVTTVRTISGSVWGGNAQLVEELSIGVEFGEDPYMLGSVRAIGFYDGEIFVLDQQVPTVRVYDSNGQHLRDLGSEGSGPGELQRPESMVIGPEGRIYIRDPRNGRIMIMSRDGEELGIIRITSSFSTSNSMVMTNDGTLYNYELLNEGTAVTDWRLGLVPKYEDETIEGEPVEPPDYGFEPPQLVARREGSMSTTNVPFSPTFRWLFTPSGALLAGVSDDYSFDIRYPDGRITRIEKSWEPVPVLADEASYNRRRSTANMQNTQADWTWNAADIPSTKPAFGNLVVDRDNRIWVLRYGLGYHVEEECNENPEPGEPFGTSCWGAETSWEVFDSEGRFLGGADLPDGVRMSPQPHIEGDTVIATFMDDLGTLMVKRYRLVTDAAAVGGGE